MYHKLNPKIIPCAAHTQCPGFVELYLCFNYFWQCLILCPVCQVLQATFLFDENERAFYSDPFYPINRWENHLSILFIQSAGGKIIWAVSIIISQLHFVIDMFIYQLIIATFVAGMASFCLRNMINLTVENVFILCSTNNTCIAECYREYIFPSGNTKEPYSCQNGN